MKLSKSLLAFLPLAGLGILAVTSLRSQTTEPRQVIFPAADTTGRARYTPPILGTQTHFGMAHILGYESGPRAMSQLRSIGAGSFRDGINWSNFRFSRPGVATLAEPRRIVGFLATGQARPLLIFGGPGFNPPLQGAPLSPDQIDQFSTYIKSVVQMTARYNPLYEVWNEYNLRVGSTKPAGRLVGAGDPSDSRAAIHYAALSRVAVQAAKSANPSAQVLVGAVGIDPDWKWTQAIVGDGALNGADGLSVHLYNNCVPVAQRNADEMLSRLATLQALLKQQRGGTTTPIYVTEFGWSTISGKCGVPRDRQAYNFAHYILQSSTLPWLRGSWIYELKDESDELTDMERNFGVFGYDDQPKPAACFVQASRAIVAAAQSVELQRPRPGIFVLRAVLPDHQVAVIWTNSLDSTARVRLDGHPGLAKFMCGQGVAANDSIPISQAPLVVQYPLGQPVSLTVSG